MSHLSNYTAISFEELELRGRALAQAKQILSLAQNRCQNDSDFGWTKNLNAWSYLNREASGVSMLLTDYFMDEVFEEAVR